MTNIQFSPEGHLHQGDHKRTHTGLGSTDAATRYAHNSLPPPPDGLLTRSPPANEVTHKLVPGGAEASPRRKTLANQGSYVTENRERREGKNRSTTSQYFPHTKRRRREKKVKNRKERCDKWKREEILMGEMKNGCGGRERRRQKRRDSEVVREEEDSERKMEEM